MDTGRLRPVNTLYSRKLASVKLPAAKAVVAEPGAATGVPRSAPTDMTIAITDTSARCPTFDPCPARPLREP